MMRCVAVALTALALALVSCEPVEQEPKQTSNDDAALCLPGDGDIRGLKRVGEPTRVSRDGISKALPAEAEIYLAYGFDHMATAQYEITLADPEADDRTVRVEVFRMTSPTAAFGVYSYQSHVLEEPIVDLGIGAGARIGARTGHVWKADCYARVEAADPAIADRATKQRILEHVTRHIAGASPKPAVLGAIPDTVPGAEYPRLFLNKTTLGNIHWLSDADILALGGGAIGAVIDTVEDARCFVVLYPDPAAAARGWEAYRGFLDARKATEEGDFVVASLQENTHAAAFRRGPYVAGVWNARSAHAATDLARKLLDHIRQLLPEPEPAPATATPATTAPSAPTTAKTPY